MSGGSYAYLYCKEVEELFKEIGYIDDMCEELEKMDYIDVARDMRRLSEYIKTAYNRIDVLAEQLRPIMKAVEWYRSSDYGLDDVEKAVAKYRSGA